MTLEGADKFAAEVAAEAFERAGRCVMAGDHAGARVGFRTACDLAPGWGAARKGLGLACLALGSVREAADAFLALCDVDREASEPRALAALCLASLGRYAGAVLYFREATVIDPSEPAHLINLGDSLICLGRPGEAREAYAGAARIMPRHPGVHFKLGVAAELSGDDVAAYASFKTAVALNDGWGRAYFLLGRVCSRLGHLGEARRAYEKAVEISPGSVESRESLCEACEVVGDVEAAARHRAVLNFITAGREGVGAARAA